MSDFSWGLSIGAVLMALILFIVLHACCDNSVSNYALNNPKYKIDTIATVHNGDTIYTYKFARK